MRKVMVGGGGKVANRPRGTLKIPIRTLRAKGLSYNKIAEKLQCSKSTINYWLDRMVSKRLWKGTERVDVGGLWNMVQCGNITTYTISVVSIVENLIC